jgi:putative acetyltransferase
MPIIRKYKETDLNAVLSSWENTQTIAHAFLPDDFQHQEKINIRELYLPNADTWVVEEDHQVVGFIALIGNEVGGLFLQPIHHGKKLGKLMMDKAQELHGDLVVDVFEKNSIGRRFYAKYGFKLVEEKVHEQTGERVLRLKFTTGKSPNGSDFQDGCV